MSKISTLAGKSFYRRGLTKSTHVTVRKEVFGSSKSMSIMRIKNIENCIYCVQDVCGKSHAWNVVTDQSQHSDLKTFGACVLYCACMHE